MSAKKALSIEAAAKQLEDAIAANGSEIAEEIGSIRERLEKLIESVGPIVLSDEIKAEIFNLTRLLKSAKDSDSKSESTETRKSVSKAKKAEFIREKLKKAKDGMQKAELVELAGKSFGTDPAPTFLDSALTDLEKAGEVRKEGGGRGNPVTLFAT